MLRYLRKRKAQSTVEYAILIIIIIGALLSIQVYIKRGVQGRLKTAADDIGEQFSPGNTNYTMTTTTRGARTNETSSTSGQGTTMLGDEVTNVTSSANIINTQMEFWGKIQK